MAPGTALRSACAAEGVAVRPVLAPDMLAEEVPLTAGCAAAVASLRAAVEAGLRGAGRPVTIVEAPDADPAGVAAFSQRLRAVAGPLRRELAVVLLVRPRAVLRGVGPDRVNNTLRAARASLARLPEQGIGVGLQLTDTVTPRYFMDIASYAAVRPCDVESQPLIELASGLPVAVGFRGAGNAQAAAAGAREAATSQTSFAFGRQGLAVLESTRGNGAAHTVVSPASRFSGVCRGVASQGIVLELADVPASAALEGAIRGGCVRGALLTGGIEGVKMWLRAVASGAAVGVRSRRGVGDGGEPLLKRACIRAPADLSPS